jgi:hypothetical protein
MLVDAVANAWGVEPDEAGRRSGSSCQRLKGAISVSRPGAFTARSDSTGALVLKGELDLGTIQQLQDKIDDIVVPGQPIVSTWPNSSSWIPVPCIVS